MSICRFIDYLRLLAYKWTQLSFSRKMAKIMHKYVYIKIYMYVCVSAIV